MSQPAFKALELPFELVFEHGEPQEDGMHVIGIHLLLDVIHQAMAERGRTDFFASGDEFVYYSIAQAREVAAGRPRFRGPDFFFIDQVEGRDARLRKGWVSWEEGGRLPDVIVELLSPSTEKIDRTVKKELYARTFRTRDYFLCDLDTGILEGFHLAGDAYQPISPDSRGRIRSEVLGLDFGTWQGAYRTQEGTWLRLFEPGGRMIPTEAEAERERADAAEARAAAAEAELARLRARLG
jgi:Uma2 family endonuclease